MNFKNIVCKTVTLVHVLICEINTCSFLILFPGEYFAAVIILLALSTAMTVVILNFKHRGVFGDKVPSWVRLPHFECVGICALP